MLRLSKSINIFCESITNPITMLDSTTWMYLAVAAVAGVLLYMYMGDKKSVAWTKLSSPKDASKSSSKDYQDMIYMALALGGAAALYYFFEQSS